MSNHAPPSSGVSLALISRGVFSGADSATGRLRAGYSPPPMRPAKVVRPAHGTYSVTFASSDVYLETWSRFPYSARIGEQTLRRASVPSEAEPSYVDWFRVCSHPFLVPGEGPTAEPGPSQSTAQYVSVLNFFVFCYVFLLFGCCFISC